MLCAFFFLGVITAADSLDRETTASYWLTVYATDRGVVPLYSTIEVYIEVEDVNDNAPLTSEPIYYPVVMENSPKDVSVIQIQAEDPDSGSNEKLTYRITSGNPQNFFAINIKTGKDVLGCFEIGCPFSMGCLALAELAYLFYCLENRIFFSGHNFFTRWMFFLSIWNVLISPITEAN